eukprot:Tbor_TRINITY_DN6122_c6_g1::TRINITY_DN6122_c6_g1_i1::g.22817::m.22817
MDLPLPIREITNQNSDIAIIDADTLNKNRTHKNNNILINIINNIGIMSRDAQGINSPLTSIQKLKENPTHKLYLMGNNNKLFGILKTGRKKLYIRNEINNIIEMM